MSDVATYDHDQPTDGWQQALHDPSSLVLYLDQARSVPLILRPVPPTGGCFWMGSNDPGLDDARPYTDPSPVTRVEIKESFYMGAFQVTQNQWRSVVDAMQRGDVASELGPKPSEFQGEYRPVEQVSWNDCRAWLGGLSSLPWLEEQLRHLPCNLPGRSLRLQLPTEAHWEWACRAVPCQGTDGTLTYRTGRTEYHAGDGERALRECGWFGGNSGGTTHAVGGLRPNALGLYDLHGNVWEWCYDPWCETYASSWDSIPADSVKSLQHKPGVRVVRGGSWLYSARWCRSALRDGWGPGIRFGFLGFRVCLFSGPIQTSDGESGPGDGVRRQAETESYGAGGSSRLQELQMPPRSGENLE